MSGVQSVDRAFAILRALASGPAGVTELADRVGLPKSTVSRMLSTLEANGAVEQTAGGGPYQLGPLIDEIAKTLGPSRTLVDLARPVLDELTKVVGEAAGIAVLDGRDVLCVLEVKAESEIQVRDWTGTLAPLHTVPAGLLFLTAFSDLELDRYLAGDLVATTDRTITGPKAIRRRLADIGRVGSVWVYGEFSADLNSVAAPIFGADGRMVAALHVHGPAFRYPVAGRADAVAALVRDMAARLSARLA